MIKLRIVLVSLLIGLLSVNSCSDRKTAVGFNKMTEFFPNQAGFSWEYVVFDSITMTTDTVTVEAIDPSSSRTERLYWKISWHISRAILELIIDERGDTLDFFIDTTFITYPYERFVFPLELGKKWSVTTEGENPFVIDNYEIIDRGTVTVPAGKFTNCLMIERTWDVDFEGGFARSVTWLAPNIGIVSRYFYRITTDGGGNFFVMTNETWKLIDYDF